jgi:hypothetical protein
MKRSCTASEPAAPSTPPPDKKQRVSSPRAAPPLDDASIASFVRDGFVLLPRAFSPSTAQKCRELIWQRLAHDGITKDSSTWVERHSIPGAIGTTMQTAVLYLTTHLFNHFF